MVARKSSKKSVETTSSVASVEPVQKVSDTLNALLALTGSVPSRGTSEPVVVSSDEDPAIAGARKNKHTVTLGFDPSIAPIAASAAEITSTLKILNDKFKKFQKSLRDYGKSKRDAFNTKLHSDVVTVEIPYLHGKDTQCIQVICSNKYSVARDTVLSIEKRLGDAFPLLFTKSETKTLKPNAEELFRKILVEVGVPKDKLDATMASLLDTNTSVSTTEKYEKEINNVPEDLAMILSQAVVRAEPGLKFPVS